MEDWTPVKTDADIAALMERYAHFHDSCLTQVHYVTGDRTDEERDMCFGGPETKELHMVFHSQWSDQALELCFTGVRQCLLPGWQDDYFSEFWDCHLAFRTDLLLPRREERLIVWTDGAPLDPQETFEILREPLPAFVIASGLQWRFAEK